MTEETKQVLKAHHSMDFATAEFERMAELRDIDLDEDDLDAEELSELKRLKKKVVKAIASNVISIDDDGQITITMRKSSHINSVTFKVRDGASILAMDKHKESQTMHKLFSMMACLTGTAVPTFSKMVDPDLGLCVSVMKLLMG